jgi:hypothetical protein
MATQVRSKRVGKVTELTVATPIRPGCVEANPLTRQPAELRTYRQRLQNALQSLQQRIETGVPISPQGLGTIHFARWFILDDEPVREDRAGRLVFTSNFDGDLKLYIRDFSTLIADDLDLVWRNCADYPAQGCRNFESFWQYILAHQIETLAFVVAYPDRTVKDIELAFECVRRSRAAFEDRKERVPDELAFRFADAQ